MRVASRKAVRDPVPALRPTVGVVVVNWRRPFDTMACLDSLTNSGYPALELVIVDNGSPDGHRELIEQEYPRVAVIPNHHNLGFAGAVNLGLSHLLNRGVDYLLLLNDDAILVPGSLEELVDTIEAHPSIGIVGPAIYYRDYPGVVWSMGGAVDEWGQTRHLGIDQFGFGLPAEPRDVAYVTGCALLAKRSVIETVGLLDERFFAYYEETEWCARARTAGFRVLVVPRARVLHKVKQGERSTSRTYLYLMARNRLLYLKLAGAGSWRIARAATQLLRTAASWQFRPRHAANRRFSVSLVRAVFDFARGCFGAPPSL